MPEASPLFSPLPHSAAPIARTDALLRAVAGNVGQSGLFGTLTVTDTHLACAAKASAEAAEYRLFADAGTLWVALVTEHRWLSQSIEADLLHTGDKMEDLIEEELVEQGWEGVRLLVEHFRDDHKLYTFRSPLPLDLSRPDAPETIDRATKALLAYESAFRELGDMEAEED